MTDSKSLQVRDWRVPTQGRVDVRTRKGLQRSRDELFDLSIRGVFIKTLLLEEPGTALDLRPALFDANFRAAAQVVWVRGYGSGPNHPCGMGVKFLDLTASQKRMLYRQIDSLLEQGARLRVGTPPGPVARDSAAGGPE